MAKHKVKVAKNPTDDKYALFICPKCGEYMSIAKVQYEGKNSIKCPAECGFHETIDFRKDGITCI